MFVQDPVSCPANFYSGMTCLGATIDCTNVDSHIDNINVTIGYVTQATTTPTGTIVFFTGGTGTASDFGPTNGFADSYVGAYEIVYVEWASAWEKASSNSTYENILHAACPNNSSPQGYDWYAAASDLNLAVSGTNKCDGTTTTTTSTEAEGVDGTHALDPDHPSVSERTQIETDMKNLCQ
jgi:hypothetical protein